MEKISGPQCFSCGGHLTKTDDGQFKCEYCGNTYPREEKKTELSGEVIRQLDIANNYRMLGRFDDAAETYETIINKYPDEVFAYWGAFLSEYGIEYVKQGSGYTPISHRISRIPATDSPYLAKLYALTSERERQSYRLKADEIESIRYKTFELSKLSQGYEIFICQSGKRHENEIAMRLYDALRAKGLKVFMPQICIPTGEVGEAYIYSAIDSAECMLIVAQSIDTLSATQNIWSRFIAIEGKRIQVIHDGLNESEFPLKLRRTIQRVAPIDFAGRDWLGEAMRFAFPPRDDEKVVIIKQAEYDDGRLSDLEKRLESFRRGSDDIVGAFGALLTYVTMGNIAEAQRTLNIDVEKFGTPEIRQISELCLELCKMSKCGEADRSVSVMKVRIIADKIRKEFPVMTEAERTLYTSIARDSSLIFLAKCFATVKDRERQCFVLDLIDCTELHDFNEVGELISMLFKNGRNEDVKEVLRLMPKVDGDIVLPMFLTKYAGDSQIVLMSIADKIFCSEKSAEALNDFMCTCSDTGLCLTLTEIMTRNKIALTVNGMSGGLSSINEPSQIRTVLDNLGTRPLSGMEVDKLVSIAVNDDDVANEVLAHLRFKSGITDLGPYNMQQFVNKCDLKKIKLRLFEFALDKKLAEKLLVEAINGSGEDRLSSIDILIDRIPVIDITQYSSVILGNDPLKADICKLLAPKTGKFADVSAVLLKFLQGRDSDENKRAVFAYYSDFILDEATRKAYLDILPQSYDGIYEKILSDFLSEFPAHAREIFVVHYERLICGYESVLPKIARAVKYMDESAVARFIVEFNGSRTIKDEIISVIWRFVQKPKKLTVRTENVECNILQAYLLTLTDCPASTEATVGLMTKSGLDARDKIIVSGKKTKFKEYVASLPAEQRAYIERYI